MQNYFRNKSEDHPSQVFRKIFLIMRLTTMIMIVAFLQVRAEAFSQQKITLSKKDVSLTNVFRHIRQQTGYTFLYSNRVLRHASAVNVDLKNASLKDALEQCLKDQPLTYHIVNNTIVIEVVNKTDKTNLPDPIKVTGTVSDEKGEPLPGVSVQIKGSQTGTITDADGAFTINVPNDQAVLIFTYIGYTRTQRPVGTSGELSVVLKAKNTGLNEIVVVGYGTQKKADVTGSISTIKSQAIQDAPTANLSQALQGLGAGIDVQKSGGNSKPGAEPTIRIRGSRSLRASNSPLLVVDGIPFDGDINDLNPDDVASIDVLKDASATAIYGSRGANGVLLITTKRGKAGKPVVTYSGYAGFTRPRGEYNIMNAKQFELLKKWARVNGNPGTYTGIDDPTLLTDGFFAPEEVEGIKTGRNTDWQKLVYHTGFMTDHHLGVSGGTETTQYDFSGGYHRETGIYPGQSFDRYSLKASLNQQLGKSVKMGISSLNSMTVTNGEDFNPMGQVLRASPMASPYDSSGNLLIGFVPGSANQVWNPLDNFVPGAEVENWKQLSTFNSLYLEVNLYKGLSYRLNAGANVRSYMFGDFYASNTSNNLGGLSSSSNNAQFSTNYTLENLLLYNRKFGKHKINFTGMYSLQESVSRRTSFSNKDIAADFLQYYQPQYGSNLVGSGTYNKWDIISYMGRLNYSFADKYLVTLTMRSDGSSVLAPGNKFHGFPSVAAAWNLTNEPFMKSAGAISNLKLRASYGTVGNSSIDSYQTLGALESVNYNYGSETTIGSYPSNAPNPKLTWEYTSTLNIGLDFGFFNGRITGSLDGYHQYTNSLLLPENLPATSGIPNSILINVGKTENKGVELTLSTINVEGNGRNTFSWTTDLNVFLNRGKIVELANGVKNDISDKWFVGHPIQTFYDYRRMGIWQNTAKDSATAKGLHQTITGTGSVIGTIRVADVNKDGKINADDRVILGSNQPKWEGGMTNRFAFKGFDFTAVLFARAGGMIYSTLYGGGYVNTFQGNYNNLNLNYWTPDNHQAVYPKPNSAKSRTPYNSVLGYFDGSYLKIRSLSLGYHLPSSTLNKLGIGNLYIYSTADAPFILFSPYVNQYKGLDPETTQNVNIDTPSNWSMVFGVKVTF
jgi:TonB-linked SusC/RagA family outer membrane protein